MAVLQVMGVDVSSTKRQEDKKTNTDYSDFKKIIKMQFEKGNFVKTGFRPSPE